MAAGGARRARLHRRVGIVSATALLLGALPLVRALQAPHRDGAPVIAGLGADIREMPQGARDLPGFRLAMVEASRSTGEGEGLAGGRLSEESARALQRMANESAAGPRLYALLEDAPTEQALAMLLTAAGVRFRMEAGVKGRITLRPIDGPRTAAQALGNILLYNVGPRLGLTREGDTYVVRVEAPEQPTAPPPGAASPGAPAPVRPATLDRSASSARASRAATPPPQGIQRDLPPAPRGQILLEPDGTIRRVAGIIIMGRAPIVALLETVPPGGSPVCETVRPGERIEPGVPGSEPYRAESVQVDGIVLRGMAGQTLLVPLVPRSSPIVRTTEEAAPQEARALSSNTETGFPRGRGMWEQETGIRRDGRPAFSP